MDQTIQITYENLIEKFKERISELEYQLILKEVESDAKTQRIIELETILQTTKTTSKDTKGANKDDK